MGKRAFNLNNFHGNLYERISDDVDIVEGFAFKFSELNSTFHVFAEVEVTYQGNFLELKTNSLNGVSH